METIEVSKETKDWLDKLRISGQTYDDIFEILFPIYNITSVQRL